MTFDLITVKLDRTSELSAESGKSALSALSKRLFQVKIAEQKDGERWPDRIEFKLSISDCC